MNKEEDAYHFLCAYTLTLGDQTFIHQHVVDAYAVQNANEKTKPIAIAFGLFGLYLHLEKNFSGREVQLAHMQLAKQRRVWPAFPLPENRGELTAADVMEVPEGPARNSAIDGWCNAVWTACEQTRELVVAQLKQYSII